MDEAEDEIDPRRAQGVHAAQAQPQHRFQCPKLFPIRRQPQKRFDTGPEGRASKNEHASLWAWTHSTRRNRRFLPEEGGQPGNAPRSASASGIWASCASNSGDHFPSNRSASNVPTALSAYHAFSFAISFSFTAAHRPFSPRQHSRPETIRQHTKLSVFKTKKEMRIFPF